jgi:hypothetical protein
MATKIRAFTGFKKIVGEENAKRLILSLVLRTIYEGKRRKD